MTAPEILFAWLIVVAIGACIAPFAYWGGSILIAWATEGEDG